MKRVFSFVILALCMFSACSKSEKNVSVNTTNTNTNAVKMVAMETAAKKSVASENVALQKSAEIVKLEKILAKLSQRCRDAIPNGDSNEFLADLKKVLATEQGDIFLLVDKQHYLPDGYVPKNLVPLKQNSHYNISRNDLSLCDYVEAALVELSEAAKADGITLMVSSTYRSYEYQTKLFNRYVAQDGMENALRYSAPPGSSQHQVGVAIDFGTIDVSFAKTKQGRWLSTNAAKYGWSLSFPEGFEDITGYMWECWHYRYIGKEACAFQKKWFSDVQQFMMEFLHEWKNIN